HPEEKMADASGAPANADTRGVLRRLHVASGRPTHIGKEVDPLDEDEDVLLVDVEPTAYHASKCDLELETAIEILSGISALKAATMLGISERRWRDIRSGKARPRVALREKIIRIARSISGPF